jgi:DNA-binding NarL/FixJ family response regulator
VTLTVDVADDQALLRVGLSGIVESAPDMSVVGQAADGREAIALVQELRPDVVLMDIRMPVLDGLEATKVIAATTETRILVLTTFDLDEYVFTALRNGASGFLLKDAPPAELLAGIRAVAAGDALLGPGITRRLIQEFATGSARESPAASREIAERVTERELTVLRLVGLGLNNHEIGQQLHISQGTAKTHVAHLLTKLDARDRVQLVILAHRAGLVERS